MVLQIWNTAATEPFVRRFLGHSDHVTRCAFADTKGQAVLSCGSDGTVSEIQRDRETERKGISELGGTPIRLFGLRFF